MVKSEVVICCRARHTKCPHKVYHNIMESMFSNFLFFRKNGKSMQKHKDSNYLSCWTLFIRMHASFSLLTNLPKSFCTISAYASSTLLSVFENRFIISAYTSGFGQSICYLFQFCNSETYLQRRKEALASGTASGVCSWDLHTQNLTLQS